MERNVYNDKVHQFLSSSGAKVPARDEFTFDSHVKTVRQLINSSKFLITTEPLRKSLLIPNPVPPRLYGLPKLHKEGEPIRPVVSFISALWLSS